MILVVAAMSMGVYANSLRNGFALDDGLLILENPAVHELDLAALLGGPWWPEDAGGSGLYRPLSGLALSAQWQLWGATPWAFHAVNVGGHALVSVLVVLILFTIVSPSGALVGGILFGLHPVHTEAVANVVGQAEIMAGGLTMLACLLYLRAPAPESGVGVIRSVGIALLYFLALASKEIAVTLPALLLILGWLRTRTEARSEDRVGGLGWLVRRVWKDLPLLLLLSAALGFFLLLRHAALGNVTGVQAAPSLRGLSTGERVLTSLSLWPEYGRLLLLPLNLASDYAPGVVFPARSITPEVLAGVLLAILVGALAVMTSRRVPQLGAGVAWSAVATLPVSHLFFPVGVLLAERTLYLPSVGVSLAAGGFTALLVAAPVRSRRLALGAAAVLSVLFAARVVTRNPVWKSDESVFRTLARHHPESYRSHWVRAVGLAVRGHEAQASEAYEAALALNPNHRSLLVEAGAFFGRARDWERAEPLLRRAVELGGWRPEPYAHLARQLILQGRVREAHRVALEGLARAGPDRLLWSLVSEAYIAEGDLEAAARARRAALSADPGSRDDWLRLAQILEQSRTGDSIR